MIGTHEKRGPSPVFLEGRAVAGWPTLAAARHSGVTLEDVVEPYLLQIGFVRRTRRGREITKQACKHLGLKYHSPAADGKKQSDVEAGLFETSEQ